MALSERETRTQLIDPMLAASGWDESLVEEEYQYRPGRLRLLGEQTVRDEPQFVDYVLRAEPRGAILAALEAKDESHAPGAGLQQALAYAVDVDAPFALASNGHEIVEQDVRTGAVRRLNAFPTPEELLERWQNVAPSRGATVTSRSGETVPNPLLQPAFAFPGARPMRYYQERAVSASIEEMLNGRHRALLSLATGTGKTFIAFNLVHKLLTTGYVKRVLFIADRVSLRDQAYNEFGGLGDRRGVVVNGQVPLQRDVHFAIYQSLYADSAAGGRVYEQYPRDFFDLVVIDECHRSGYGDWGAILDYFSGAFHLGMTATPKQDDSIDTYAFFASENLDADGQPRPVYEYSLGRGIDDGFLATYKVLRVNTTVDDGLVIKDEVEKGAELLVPEGTTPRDVYDMKEFEREIIVPDRTRVLCEHLAGVLRKYGALDKTMVFCVTMEHAELVRSELQRLLGSETGKNLYAARIVSEERDAMPLLEQFQLASSTEPVVVTTVDLLTTGVNAPSVRNIVFMKPVGSVTTFKQIIGRGSRLDELTGKTFFRVIDYTNATRLFDDWDLPSLPSVQGPLAGETSVAGTVRDDETAELIAGASISVRLGGRLLAETSTDDDGAFSVGSLPPAVVDVFITASGYTRRHLRVDTTTGEATQMVVALRRPSQGERRLKISGIEVSIAEEIEVDLGNGHILKPSEYLARAREVILERVQTLEELRSIWQAAKTRGELEEYLALHQVTPELLSLVLARTDVDGFDLLAAVAFGASLVGLGTRATAAVTRIDAEYPTIDGAFITALLDKFRLGGVGEIATSEIFGLSPFVTDWGGVLGVTEMFGGPAAVGGFLRAVQVALFELEIDE
ncbi:EcoAI/FtnUII family type I restriction enzme subunit R [Microbacterium sp. ASV49]|uniref:DEAD/DEAH box helicase family protein n=1 Tax=Microbacterium candidum TaxID=3041922 RepID=A0ABT7N049_9MICO|nr:type I restriction endonuclease subunit R [Microbacterium sp. ASV49]MDL9980074.1 DEAD/DEAH box helicase family protein [Microbacterium sp. ASV49]